MQTCFHIPRGDDAAFPITLEQRANGSFRVTYGVQVEDRLTYERAVTQLGSAMMHNLACLGRLDASEEV